MAVFVGKGPRCLGDGIGKVSFIISGGVINMRWFFERRFLHEHELFMHFHAVHAAHTDLSKRLVAELFERRHELFERRHGLCRWAVRTLIQPADVQLGMATKRPGLLPFSSIFHWNHFLMHPNKCIARGWVGFTADPGRSEFACGLIVNSCCFSLQPPFASCSPSKHRHLGITQTHIYIVGCRFTHTNPQ